MNDPAAIESPGTAGYFISAPWRSSGKTIISIGLTRAAARQNITVQTFKKGPDFIDPLWLKAASGTACYNLDPYIQQNNQWRDTYANHTHSGCLALVEGTMGLHDGLESDGSDSNAGVAKALNLPVVLVVDCRGMHRTVAALVNGVQQFDSSVRFAGVILNRIRSARHEEKLYAALNEHSDIALIGTVPESTKVHLDEKQLGLTPLVEHSLSGELIDNAADLVTENCNLETLFKANAKKTVVAPDKLNVTPQSGVKVGIAKDAAFHFYYQDDLDAFAELGVELVEVSPLKDKFPADLDGLIIGGGFPERHAQQLSENQEFIFDLRESINNGLVVHAECAGLMYLSKQLTLEDGSFDMVGIINGCVKMRRKPQGRGYMQLQALGAKEVIAAHEFHHSEIQFDSPQDYLFNVMRGHGIDGTHDGVAVNNVQASYAHFRQTREYPWVKNFVQRVIDGRKEDRQKEQADKHKFI